MNILSRLKSVTWISGISCLLLALLLRLGLSTVLPDFPVVSDSLDYQMIGEHLSNYGDYLEISEDKILYPPIYPLLLSAVFRLQGSIGYSWVFLIQMLCVGATAWLVFLLVHRFTKHSGLATLFAGLSLIWPYFLLYAHIVGTEPLYIFLLLASVTSFVFALDTPSTTAIVRTGVLFGLAVLTRPVALFLPLGIVLAYAFMLKIRWIPRQTYLMRLSVGTLLVSSLTLLPWIGYVRIRFDRLIPVASNLSFVAKKANSTLAYLPEHAGKNTGASTLQEVLTAKVRNVILFWDPGADGENVDILAQKLPSARFMAQMYKLGFLGLLLLGLMGAWLSRKNTESLVVGISILYVWAVHTVLFPFPRYTLPVHPFVFVYAALAFSSLLPLWPTHSWSSFRQKMKLPRSST